MDPTGHQPSYNSINGAEETFNYHHALAMESGGGTCHIASSFYEIMRDSGLQNQIEHGWGNAYSGRRVSDSASLNPSDTDECGQSTKSQSRKSSKSSSRKHLHKRDRKDSKSSKSLEKQKKSRNSDGKNETGIDEENIHATQAGLHQQHFTDTTHSDGKTGGEALYGGNDLEARECFSGLNSELETLRLHLLHRANAGRRAS